MILCVVAYQYFDIVKKIFIVQVFIQICDKAGIWLILIGNSVELRSPCQDC